MPDDRRDGTDTLRVPFIFVKHGEPPPLEWMARHPDWVKIPAVMIRRDSSAHPANGGRYPTFPLLPAAPEPAPPQPVPPQPPVAAYLRAQAAFDPRNLARFADRSTPAAPHRAGPTAQPVGDARERA